MGLETSKNTLANFPPYQFAIVVYCLCGHSCSEVKLASSIVRR